MEMINRYMKNVLIFTVMLTFLFKKCFSNDAHTNLISILEMNYPLEFSFVQKYNNDKIYGWMIIAGNGMARTEFAPPNHNLIVADGKWIMFYDPEIDRTTYIPLDKGIFGALLNPKEFNSINKLEVSKLDNDSITTYSIVSKSFIGSELKIYFRNSENILSSWEILENGKTSIKVKILKITKLENIKSLNKNIFKFLDSMRADKKAFLGPYDRNFKKLPTSNSN